MAATKVEIPRLRTLGRHAIPHLIEATVIPLILFYGGLWLIGIWGALLVGLTWSLTAIGRRAVAGKPIPGLLLLGAFGITARTIVAFATGSVFIYFLQPTLTTVAIAGAFLLSLALGQPLAQRLASDFWPFPQNFLVHPGVRHYFSRLTLLWAAVQLANAAITLTLLISQSTATFVWARSATTWVVTGSAILVSTVWFVRSMQRHNIEVVWVRGR
jgi:hypothetical protein